VTLPTLPQAELVPTDTEARFRAAVLRSAALLRAGKVVALPTETVYGLAANAFDPKAVAEVFAVKGRPAHNPIIVHVAGLDMARRCVSNWPASAEDLAQAFWPGPLTLVLPRATMIPDAVTAGGPTVGVRWPSHPLIQAVIAECGFPLAAPSANPAGGLSPTTAQHVLKALGGALRLIVDGGPTQVGIESTVVDLTDRPHRILRPGMIHQESLAAVLGASLEGEVPTAGDRPRRSPGQLPKHYAPKARLLVRSWASEAELRQRLAAETLDPAVTWVVAHTQIPSLAGWRGVSVVPRDAEAYARALYAELHRCDEAGAQGIVVEAVPATAAWRGIRDRLLRAAV